MRVFSGFVLRSGTACSDHVLALRASHAGFRVGVRVPWRKIEDAVALSICRQLPRLGPTKPRVAFQASRGRYRMNLACCQLLVERLPASCLGVHRIRPRF